MTFSPPLSLSLSGTLMVNHPKMWICLSDGLPLCCAAVKRRSDQRVGGGAGRAAAMHPATGLMLLTLHARIATCHQYNSIINQSGPSSSVETGREADPALSTTLPEKISPYYSMFQSQNTLDTCHLLKKSREMHIMLPRTPTISFNGPPQVRQPEPR